MEALKENNKRIGTLGRLTIVETAQTLPSQISTELVRTRMSVGHFDRLLRQLAARLWWERTTDESLSHDE